MLMPDFEGFYKRCEEARRLIERMRSPLIVNHYDADGISSGALVARALRMRGIQFRMKTVRKLAEKEMEEIAGEKELIFTDLGSSIAREAREWKDRSVVMIDHHETDVNEPYNVNCNLFGFDGGRDASSASTAYFVFRDPELVELGIVGAVGDMQLPFRGLNSVMVEEGMRAGRVRREKDLTLFGRVSRALVWFLQYSTEPYIPGLTGSQRNCALLLKELGIELKEGERWRKYHELSAEERVKFVSGLVAYMYHMEMDEQVIRSVVDDVYLFPHQPQGTELSDANEFSTLLNACGRHNEPEVGVGVCLGDEKAYERARQLLQLHRRQLREGIEFASENVEDFGAFYFVDGRGVIDDGIIGVVAGMLYGGKIRHTKPIIAIALNAEGQIKVSGRATRRLVERGIDLGAMMRKATEGFGTGGGHNIAAGAQIEPARINEFLLRCGELVSKQLLG